MAQSIVGTALDVSAAAIARRPCFELLVAWGKTANDTIVWATSGVDETARMLSVNWNRELNIDSAIGIGRGSAATCSFTLDNRDNRYSPYNTTGALYALLTSDVLTPGLESIVYPRFFMTPVRLRAGFISAGGVSEYMTVFVGYIDEVSETYGVSGGTITVQCLDRASKLIQLKASTTMRINQATDDWLKYLVSSLGGTGPTTTKVDPALFIIPFCWLDDEGLWSEMQQAAASEGGYAFFDELGDFTFRNALWWATAGHSLLTNTSFTVASFTEITPGYDWKSVATGAIVEYQSRWNGGEQVLWERKQAFAIPPGGTTLEAKYRYPSTDAWNPVFDTDWLPINAGGIIFDNNEVQVSLQNKKAQRAKLNFTNSSHETAFVLSIRVRGTAVVGGPNEEVERNVAVPLVPENRIRVSSNPYVQTLPQAELLADLLADRMQYPRLVYKLVGVKAKPWLQLGDKITIVCADPFTVERTAIIAGLSFSWSPEARFAMTVSAIDSMGLYPYSSFFTIGTGTVGSVDVIYR